MVENCKWTFGQYFQMLFQTYMPPPKLQPSNNLHELVSQSDALLRSYAHCRQHRSESSRDKEGGEYSILLSIPQSPGPADRTGQIALESCI